MVERLYLIHSTRGFDGCPACGQYVIWRKIGDRKYVPCDKEPVMCYQSPGAFMRVVKKGELLSNVQIVSQKNIRDAVGRKVFYALQPHVFTCPCIPHRGENYD